MKELNFLSELYKTLFLVLCFLAVGENANSQSTQYKKNTEIGFLGSAAYYLGDLNKTHFSQSSPAAGLVIRKNHDRRFSYKTEALFLSLRSDERMSTDPISLDRGLHFKSLVYELSGQVEFNFLPYELGNPLYPWSPFLYTGISIFNFNPQAENKNGQWVNLQELGTEGQGSSAFPERKVYSLIQLAIPIGGGIKIAVNEFFNIVLECGVRKTFTDYLDDVSMSYPGKNIGAVNEYPIEMNQASIEMSDPTGTHILGDQRGNPDKKDWYSFAGITLSFKLKKTTIGCDY